MPQKAIIITYLLFAAPHQKYQRLYFFIILKTASNNYNLDSYLKMGEIFLKNPQFERFLILIY